jgi:hypothetical protein
LLLADVDAKTPGGGTRTGLRPGAIVDAAEIYEVVLAAQKQAIAAVTPGSRYLNSRARLPGPRRGSPISASCGNPIELAATMVALLFPHGVGHRWVSTCTTWKTSVTALATHPDASARRCSGCGRCGSTGTWNRGWP